MTGSSDQSKRTSDTNNDFETPVKKRKFNPVQEEGQNESIDSSSSSERCNIAPKDESLGQLDEENESGPSETTATLTETDIEENIIYPNIDTLSDDVLLVLLSYLNSSDLLNLSL